LISIIPADGAGQVAGRRPAGITTW